MPKLVFDEHFFSKHERDLYFQSCLVLGSGDTCVAVKCIRRDRRCVGVGRRGAESVIRSIIYRQAMHGGEKKSVCSQICLQFIIGGALPPSKNIRHTTGSLGGRRPIQFGHVPRQFRMHAAFVGGSCTQRLSEARRIPQPISVQRRNRFQARSPNSSCLDDGDTVYWMHLDGVLRLRFNLTHPKFM